MKTYTIKREFRAYNHDEFVDWEAVETFSSLTMAIYRARELNRTEASYWEALPGICEYTSFSIEVDTDGEIDTIIDSFDLGFVKQTPPYYIDKIEDIAFWMITLLQDADIGDYKSEREEAERDLFKIYATAQADGVNVDELKTYWINRIACIRNKW